MKNLLDYSNNIFSQNGEDGIISHILHLISQNSSLDNHCVEFGAWDGIFLSNTFHLVKTLNYRGLYIENSTPRFKSLVHNMKNYDTICLNRFVGIQEHDNLDIILTEVGFPYNFDVLSVDIDGCDYHIIQSLTQYRPKIVVVEYNPLIPNEVHYVQSCDYDVNQGSSILAFQQLGSRMSYTLVAATKTNAILVDSKYVTPDWNISSDLQALRPDQDEKIYVCFGFDGTLLFSKNIIYYPWLNLTFRSEDFQSIPLYLRKYYRTFFLRLILAIYLAIFRPHSISRIGISPAMRWIFRK